jgi:tetratricopeptide (TPR) repeat protein
MQASGSPVPTAAAADALYEQGRLAEAETAYRSLLLLEPESQHALLQLGRIADRNGDFSSSAALYQRAIAQRPGEVQPLIERAASLMSQRRFTEALVDLDAAIALDANSALAHFNRGAANENLNRQRQAIADYGAAIDLDRGMVQAYLRRAALTETSNPAAARADYQSVLRLAASATALQTAQERLQALGGKSSKPAAVNPGEQRVFVQYSEAADRAAVEALRKALAAALAPVSVPGIDKVSLRWDGEVRYFFAEDRELALRVAQATELQLARTGMARQLKPTFRDAAAFPNAARGSVELWLPALSLVAPQRGGEAVKK